MKIRQIVFRLLVALITFAVGVSAVLIWLNYFAEPTWEAITNAPAVENVPVYDLEDYAVYSSVLARNYHSEVVVIGDITSHFHEDLASYETAPRLTGDTIDDYRQKNKLKQKLWNGFRANKLVIMLSQSEEKELFPPGEAGWERFYQKYPTAKGIVYFSAVGYNAERTQALVYFTYQSGKSGSSFCFVFLEKKKGVWISSQADNTWIVE